MAELTPTTVTAPPVTASASSETPRRESLDGCWKLDRNRGEPSMRGYLETLNVAELAIQAHEKGEQETDTFHTIELSGDKVKITKRSRVNSDLVVELTLGVEHVEYLQPDSRPKKQLASTEDPGKHLQIQSSLLTVNGMAHVTDVKRLVQEENDTKSVMIQELTITNPESGKTHTTTRYFNPYDGLLEVEEESGDKMEVE
ncbi:hypothetical protein IV203_016096 [Nitzschia inconspicua]|uniref:Uncharacterized protein n=1 Tax=Nitzschia inconspicua TaxID=303405 RepID=A0A9K3KQ24_9STRA|nr:hypothetical protein IV203_016096 [Nitzschia inconspicua]